MTIALARGTIGGMSAVTVAVAAIVVIWERLRLQCSDGERRRHGAEMEG
jgi:hypothetical protein